MASVNTEVSLFQLLWVFVWECGSFSLMPVCIFNILSCSLEFCSGLGLDPVSPCLGFNFASTPQSLDRGLGSPK